MDAAVTEVIVTCYKQTHYQVVVGCIALRNGEFHFNELRFIRHFRTCAALRALRRPGGFRCTVGFCVKAHHVGLCLC